MAKKPTSEQLSANVLQECSALANKYLLVKELTDVARVREIDRQRASEGRMEYAIRDGKAQPDPHYGENLIRATHAHLALDIKEQCLNLGTTFKARRVQFIKDMDACLDPQLPHPKRPTASKAPACPK
jgi:hypothetical protein